MFSKKLSFTGAKEYPLDKEDENNMDCATCDVHIAGLKFRTDIFSDKDYETTLYYQYATGKETITTRAEANATVAMGAGVGIGGSTGRAWQIEKGDSLIKLLRLNTSPDFIYCVRCFEDKYGSITNNIDVSLEGNNALLHKTKGM